MLDNHDTNLCLEEQMILNDPAVSFWLKSQIQGLNKRDVLDALNDAELLVSICKKRFNHLFKDVES